MNNPAPRAEISPGRQLLYYFGMGLTAIGLLMFLSVFVSAFSDGPFSSGSPSGFIRTSPGGDILSETPIGTEPVSFEQRSSGMAKRAFGGFALMFIGGILTTLGRAGLRGSGVILDPHGARDDLKPWSQAAGGMLDDTLNASEFANRAVERISADNDDKPREIVRVRCPNCRTLNDEDAKFCDNCGAAL